MFYSCQVVASFYPPSGFSNGITQYTVQWDTVSTFVHAISAGASCTSVGYGSCAVTGVAIQGVPPFSYQIERVSLGVTYYVRVSARNSISTQSVDPTGDIPDNTKWSSVAKVVPADQPPSAPLLVVPAVSGPTSVQIVVTPPLFTGGCPGGVAGSLDQYLLEWDQSATFDDKITYGNITIPASQLLPALTGNFLGDWVYDLSGLTTGTSYWLRVSAHNSIGFGPTKLASMSVVPSGKPGAPSSVSLLTATSQDTPITSANVTWTAPLVSGGSVVTGYLVEWWEPINVPEVQQIQFIDYTTMTPTAGDFYLFFGPQVGVSWSTEKNSYSTTGANIRSQLVNLGYAAGYANNYQYSFPLNDVTVSQSVVPNVGAQWKVTFTGNPGNQVLLQSSTIASGSTSSVVVSELVTGRRANGYSEQQIITLLAVNTNSTSDLSGYFTLSFNSSAYSTVWLPVTASASRVARAISQLNTLRTVTVTQTQVATYTRKQMTRATN